ATILKNQPVRNSEGEITGTTTYGDYSYSETSNTKPFEKKGPLGGVKNVVFLVTGNTASSSELVVNSLRAVPALKIQLVGTTTYGKPVGFFPVRLEGKYDLYLASFSTKNANNQGDYFDGFKPGTDIPGTEMLYTIDGEQTDYDEVSDYDFGDKNELYLAEALRLLGVNSNSTTSTIMGVHNAKTNTSASIKLIKG